MEVVVLVLAVVAILAGLAGWSGFLRIAARSYAPLVATLAALLCGAGLCVAISMSKTQGFLAGIVGYLFFWALLCVSAGLVLGAVLRLIWRWSGKEQPATRPAPAPWDVIGFSTLAMITVVLSAME